MGSFVLSLLVFAAAVILLLLKGRKGGPVIRIVGIAMLVLGAVLFLFSTVVVIDAGEIGVKVVFGRVSETALRNGVHVVPPYANIIRYPVRLVEITQVAENLIEARVNNGLTIKLDCTARYSIDPEMAPEVYTSVATSVEDLGAKIAAQQEAEAMTYKKQKAEQEAQIRIVEARGLAQAQEIINSTLTPTYLQHEAIQAYRDLAGSPNTTFVILPTSPTSSGIPLILNAQR